MGFAAWPHAGGIDQETLCPGYGNRFKWCDVDDPGVRRQGHRDNLLDQVAALDRLAPFGELVYRFAEGDARILTGEEGFHGAKFSTKRGRCTYVLACPAAHCGEAATRVGKSS